MKENYILRQGLPLPVFDRNSGSRHLDNVCGQCCRNASHARRHKGVRLKHDTPPLPKFRVNEEPPFTGPDLITQGHCVYETMMEPYAMRTYVFSRAHQLELSTRKLFRTFQRSHSYKHSEDSAVGSPFLEQWYQTTPPPLLQHPTI